MRNEIRLQQSVLTSEDMIRVRAATRNAKELAMIEVLATCRRAEAAGLKWGDLRLAEGIAYIRRGKGGRADWTLLLETTKAALTAWHAAAGSPAPEAWVFTVPPNVGHPTRTGGPYTPGGFDKIVRSILRRAGCWARGLGSCHRMRRSFATSYIREHPQDTFGLMRLMRHRQLSTTQRYCFLQPDDLAPRLARVRL